MRSASTDILGTKHGTSHTQRSTWAIPTRDEETTGVGPDKTVQEHPSDVKLARARMTVPEAPETDELGESEACLLAVGVVHSIDNGSRWS